MMQPFERGIVEEGEFSMIYLNGTHSHSILKTPKRGDFRVQEEHGSEIVPITPEPALLAAGDAAIAAVGQKLLYARADLVRSGDTFRVMELELVEPSLYLRIDAAGAGAVRGRRRLAARVRHGPHPAGSYGPPALVEDVRVDHRRLHVRVAQQFLHGADVVAVFEQVRREAVAERVAADRLLDAAACVAVATARCTVCGYR